MSLSPYALQTKWYEPWLTVDDVAALISVKPQTIRQYLAGTGAESFPQPQAKAEGKNLWSSASIYDFILANRPQYVSRIPRLYPRIVDPPPAQFLGSEIMQIDHRVRAALHYWQPGDGYGPIIVAYVSPSTSSAQAQWFSEKIAAERRVSSVIVPETALARIAGGGAPKKLSTPAVAVTDTEIAAPSLGERVDDIVNMYSWRELANLLRTDIPYWAPGLNDITAIDAWRPGDPARVVRPCWGELSSLSLRAALSAGAAARQRPSAGAELSAAIDQACRVIDYRLAIDCGLLPGTGGQLYPHIPEQLGLTRAAVPDLVDRSPITVPDVDVFTLLHARAALDRADDAVLVGWVTGLWPAVMSDCQIISRGSLGPLGSRWRDRLTRVTDRGQRREMGFLMLPGGLRSNPTADYFVDPERAHCWVVETAEEIFITQRRALPEARGSMQRVEIQKDPHQGPAIFVEDEVGMVWLLPHFSSAGSLSVGCGGAGPRRLAQLLTDLLDDASATPSTDPPQDWISGVEEPNALRDFLINTPAPISLSRADLLAFLDGATTPPGVSVAPCATCGFVVPTPLAELPHSVVGLDDRPGGTPGVIVSARGHFHDVFGIPRQELAALMADAQATARNLRRLPDVENVNIGIVGAETHVRVHLEAVGSWRPASSPSALRELADKLR